MNAKAVFLQFLPHILYKRLYRKNHFNLFLDRYKNYINCTAIEERVINHEMRNFESVVSVQGLGFTGSGAVLDLLSEVDSCDVVGTIYDKDNSEDHNGLFECDFLRLSGCLFEIEKYVGSSNIFQNDALLNRFVDYLNNFLLFKNSNKVQKHFLDFFYNVVDLQISDINGVPYNCHLRGNKTSSSIFFLKRMTVDRYRSICRYFLDNLFNELNVSHKKYLVFDQLLSDFEFDFVRYNDYIPGVKIIFVYRDPRDVYTYAKAHIKEEGWMAHDNVDDFVLWYKILIRNINMKSRNMLVIQFEKLILDYENERTKILNYLGIDKSEIECREKTMFDPEMSKKNIGIWKSSTVSKRDFDKIATELKEYCFFA